MLRDVFYAAATDTLNAVINAVYITSEDGYIEAVATDGKRLAQTQYTFDEISKGQLELLLYREVVDVLMKVATGDVSVAMVGTEIVCTCADCVFAGRLLEGEYVEYNRITTQALQASNTIAVSKNTLLQAIKRVGTMSATSMALTTTAAGLRLHAKDTFMGEAEELVDAEITGEANIMLNWHYLLDAVEHCYTDTVEIHVADAMSPVVVKPGDATGLVHVIMPMRG